MKYLSSYELKELQQVPIDAQLLHIFIMKPRMDDNGFSNFGNLEEGEKIMVQELSELLHPSGEMNREIVKARITAMRESGFISLMDVRKLGELLRL